MGEKELITVLYPFNGWHGRPNNGAGGAPQRQRGPGGLTAGSSHVGLLDQDPDQEQ